MATQVYRRLRGTPQPKTLAEHARGTVMAVTRGSTAPWRRRSGFEANAVRRDRADVRPNLARARIEVAVFLTRAAPIFTPAATDGLRNGHRGQPCPRLPR